MPGIGPDLAGRILAAETRNIAKHVGERGRMSSTERDLMQAENVIAMSEEERQRVRIGNLLLRRMRGHRLTDEEKEEIDDTFPTSRSAARAITRESYKESQKHYAAVYATSDRTIKTWISEGRAKNDLPPLDDPTQMAAWYGRVKQRRVPVELLRLQAPAGATSANGASTPHAAAQPGQQTPTAPAKPIIVDLNADFSYDMAVQIAAENLQYAQEQLRQARKDVNNTGRVEVCERSVTRAISEYRKAKSEEHENMKRSGGSVDKRVIMEKFRNRLSAVNQGVRSCGVRVGTKLALSPEVVRQITRALNEELDAVFEQLKDDGWVHKERLTLEAA